MTQPFPSRPRYMHLRTYQNLRRQYEAAVGQYAFLSAEAEHALSGRRGGYKSPLDRI